MNLAFIHSCVFLDIQNSLAIIETTMESLKVFLFSHIADGSIKGIERVAYLSPSSEFVAEIVLTENFMM